MQTTSEFNNDDVLRIRLRTLPAATVSAMVTWLKGHVPDVAMSFVGQVLYIVSDKGTLQEISDGFNQRFGMLSEHYTIELK